MQRTRGGEIRLLGAPPWDWPTTAWASTESQALGHRHGHMCWRSEAGLLEATLPALGKPSGQWGKWTHDTSVLLVQWGLREQD